MKKLLLLITLLPGLAAAYTLDVTQGVRVYTINGKKVASTFAKHYSLPAGKNQLAVLFDGKLRAQGKSEQFESNPYLLTFVVTKDLRLTTVSKKHKKVVALAKQGQPLFKIDSISTTQKPLPAISNTLPYADIPALVNHYNQENGIYFADTGLKKLSTVALKKHQQAQQSMPVMQLKYWYSQASNEEIAIFEQWQKELKSKR